MTQNTITDPRPHYDRALGWARELVRGVRADQLTLPTPCPEFDVRSLLGHLLATLDRVRVMGQGGDPRSAPSMVNGVPDTGWTAAFDAARTSVWTVWADDELLDATRTAPWGETTGRDLLWGYLNEALVHGWDLAVATDQPREADPELAEAALAAFRRTLPAQGRGGPVPFGPVIEPAPGAGPTERLANWSGHRAG